MAKNLADAKKLAIFVKQKQCKTNITKMSETITRRPKSVKLLPDELKQLRKFRKGFATEVECAIRIGIDRTVLNRILLTGSGSLESISKIREIVATNIVDENQ